MYSILVFRPWFCCFMILLWCIFYAMVMWSSWSTLFLGGTFLCLLLESFVIFWEYFDPSWVHLKAFALIAPLLFNLLVVVHLFCDLQCPSLVLHSFGYMLILVVGTLFFTQAFIFWMLLCCLVYGSIVFLVGVENCTSPSCCSFHCHLCGSFHIINCSHRNHQYCYMN